MTGEYITLGEAARHWRSPKPPCIATVRRAIERGKPSRKSPGTTIRLRAEVSTQGLVTTLQYLDDYFAALHEDRLGVRAPSPSLNERASRANTVLASLGW
jgi:hypothetical protein